MSAVPEQSRSSPGAVPDVALRGASSIPQLGFGVFQVPPAETEVVAAKALEAGYRHLDTAAAYRNEAGVGLAFRASGLPRSDVHIVSKCWNEDQGFDQARRAFLASLQRLELDYLDLYLIHWPVPAHDRYVETWKALIELRDEGLIRAIGVSNFEPEHLHRVIEETGETPAVNQVELHPYFQQAGLRREHEELGIVTEAYSPLAQGAVLDDPVIAEIAQHHGRTTGQVVIRWQLQLGNIVIPKSVTAERIEQNFQVFDFELGEGEMERIEALDEGRRIGGDPKTFIRP
jgi:2,5-diketo-D-gluconate reductase A